MVNKKGVWFLTLFSLILVLSVYYITMPTELLIEANTAPVVEKEDSTLLVALRVEDDDKVNKEIEDLKKIISNGESTIEDKNTAFEKIKEINANRSKEEILENKIKEKYKLDSFIKITEDKVSVTILSNKHNKNIANNIMRSIQENYEIPLKITIKFQEK